MDEDFTKGQIKKMLTYMVSFEKVYNSFNDRPLPVAGNCFCPFHDNTNTPAAKFYRESNTLYCYTDLKLYSVYDLLLEYNQDPITIFYSLWNSYNDAKKQYVLSQVDKPYTTKCLFNDSLISYDNGLISYDDLCLDIYNSIDGLKDQLIILYNLSRQITEKDISKVSDYTWLGEFKQNTHIRCITSGELINHTKYFSRNILAFIREHNDVTIIFNMYQDKPVGATLRGNKTKAFMDIGNCGGMFYNLLNLDNFKKGDPIVLVEGPKDCEAFRLFYHNKYHCLSVMTGSVSKSQLQTLRALTDKVILCLDNDETGIKNTQTFLKRYKGYFDIYPIHLPVGVKDFGDMITLYRKNKDKFKEVYRNIEKQLDIDFV